MYYLIGAVLISGLLYWVLQGKEDEKAKAEGRAVTSTAGRVMLFFFLLIVTTFVFYFVGNSFGGQGAIAANGGSALEGAGGKDYKAEMVKKIREDVIVGLPPFGGFTEESD